MKDWSELHQDVLKAERIADTIRPLLGGVEPEIQGAILAELLSYWLAGHPDFAREPILAHHVRMVRELVGVSEKIMFGDDGHPGNQG